jgi:hypothetical protein
LVGNGLFTTQLGMARPVGGKNEHLFAVWPQEDFPVKLLAKEIKVKFIRLSGRNPHIDDTAGRGC